MAHEGLDAQDRVVAPVVRVAELPPGHAEREQPPGDAAGELLRTGVQRGRVGHLRQRLDDAGARVLLHQPHHVAPACRRSSCCRRRARPCSGSCGPSGGRSRPRCRPCAWCGACASGRTATSRSHVSRQHRAQPLDRPASRPPQRRILGVGQHEHVEAAAARRWRRATRRWRAGRRTPRRCPRCRSASRARCARRQSIGAARAAQLGRIAGRRATAPRRPSPRWRSRRRPRRTAASSARWWPTTMHRGCTARSRCAAPAPRRPSPPPAPAARGGAGAPRHARRSRNVRRRSSAAPARAQTAGRARSRTTAHGVIEPRCSGGAVRARTDGAGISRSFRGRVHGTKFQTKCGTLRVGRRAVRRAVWG